MDEVLLCPVCHGSLLVSNACSALELAVHGEGETGCSLHELEFRGVDECRPDFDCVPLNAGRRGAGWGRENDTADGGAWPFERAAPPPAQSWEWAYRAAQLLLLTHLCQSGHNPLITKS